MTGVSLREEERGGTRRGKEEAKIIRRKLARSSNGDAKSSQKYTERQEGEERKLGF